MAGVSTPAELLAIPEANAAGRRVALATFGCRVNRCDTAELRGALAARGWEVVEEGEPADVVVVNSCTVTAAADRDARAAIRRAARAGAEVVVTGCWAERAPEEVALVPGVRLTVRGTEKRALPERVGALFGDSPGAASAAPPRIDPVGRESARFFLKVQEGCDVRCAFCVIPDARGPARSTPPDAVLATLGRAVEAGFVEAILAGVHLGSYGRDLPGRPTLAALCRRALDETGLRRLRLGSLEPWGVRDDLVALLHGEPRFLPSLHLPLQSGSDRVLRAMRRPMTAAAYLRAVEQVLEARPETTIFLDVLVGFPGESDADFAETCTLLERFPWTKLHVFPYSPRPGTPAAALPAQVPPAVKRARAAHLIAWSERRFVERMQARVGSRDSIVVERAPHGFGGHTRDNLPVVLRGAPVGLRAGTSLAVVLTGLERDSGRLQARPLAGGKPPREASSASD